jgi:hypothetical protein
LVITMNVFLQYMGPGKACTAVKACMVFSTAAGMLAILATMFHYTLDVALGAYITQRSWDTYHDAALVLPLRSHWGSNLWAYLIGWLEDDGGGWVEDDAGTQDDDATMENIPSSADALLQHRVTLAENDRRRFNHHHRAVTTPSPAAAPSRSPAVAPPEHGRARRLAALIVVVLMVALLLNPFVGSVGGGRFHFEASLERMVMAMNGSGGGSGPACSTNTAKLGSYLDSLWLAATGRHAGPGSLSAHAAKLQQRFKAMQERVKGVTACMNQCTGPASTTLNEPAA